MEYQNDITIDAPIGDVYTKFSNPDNLSYWQRGLRSVEHISGNPQHEGSRSKMIYKIGNRKMELIQTIDKKTAPSEWSVTYNSEGMDNIQINSFSENHRGDTVWKSKNEFLPLNLKMRLFILLFPSTFKKQSKQYMKDFKNFVEKNISVRDQ